MHFSSGGTGLNNPGVIAASGRRIRWPRTLAVSATLGLLVALAGCGGKNGATANSLVSATAELGQPNFTSPTPNRGGGVTGIGLAAPTGAAAVYMSGTTTRVYVADTANNRILGWNEIPLSASTVPDFVLGQGNLTDSAYGYGANNLNGPSSVRVELDSTPPRLVVADTGNNRVLVWSTLPTATGGTEASSPDIIVGASGAISASTLSGPTDAMIAHDKLFVADKGNDRVLIYNSITNAASANIVLGQPDFTTDEAKCVGNYSPDLGTSACPQANSPATNIESFVSKSNQLYAPTGLYVSGSRLLVADTANNRVLIWSSIPTASSAAANIALGQVGFVPGSGNNTASGLRAPTGVGEGGASGVYVADTGNNRVLHYSSPQNTGDAADLVFGQSDFTHSAANDDNQNGVPDYPSGTAGSNVSTPTARTLNKPSAVNYYNGVLYIADTANNRIMEFAAY